MKPSTFLAILAVIYLVFGVGAMLAPSQVFAPQGISLNAPGEVMARAGAAATLGLATIFWLVRGVGSAPALRAVLAGNAVYVFVEAIALAVAVASGVAGAAAWGGVVLDAIFGVASLYFYSRVGS